MRINWRVLAGAALSIGALALVLWGMDWGALRTTLAGANYWWLLPFLALEVAVIWTRALRWRIMLEDRLPTARLFWITNIGYLLNNVLPLRLGEVGRVYLVTRRSTVGVMQGLSSVVVERLVDVLCLIVLIFLLLPLVPGSVAFVAAGMTLSGVAMAAIALIFIAAHLHT
ncbi:MAG: lysylphosphatidylglycerol synthase transmembrane domain-containing protein, partial [Chloroflexi bacterium]|nr:lysylphosphatidylglycerol synthase transmembrane domain-containing protein [Chloroflexota bacterium]